AADREAEAAQRAHLVASPAADARGAAEEEPLVERNVVYVASTLDRSGAQTVRHDEPPGDRQVMASLQRGGPVVVGAPEPVAGLLQVRVQDVPRSRVEQTVGRVPIEIDRDGRQRSLRGAIPRIQAERDQVVADLEVQERLVVDGAALVLVDEGHADELLRRRLVPQGRAAAELVRR